MMRSLYYRICRVLFNLWCAIIYFFTRIQLYALTHKNIISKVPNASELHFKCKGPCCNNNYQKLEGAMARTKNSRMNGNGSLDTEWMEPFSILLKCWHSDEKLTAHGRKVIFNKYRDLLTERVKIHQYLKQHPGVNVVPIARPVFIIGMLGSGCDVLHHLLSVDPANKTTSLWEVTHLIPPPFRGDPKSVAKIKQTQRHLGCLHNLNPSILSHHPHRACMPAQCQHTFQCSFVDLVSPVVGQNMSEYRQWMKSQSERHMASVYRFYKKQLQILACHQGFGLRTYILCDPLHLLYMDALLEVFPNACIIQTHCDPADSVATYCSYYELLSQMYYKKKDISRKSLALRVLDMLTWMIDQMMEFRTRNKRNSNILDVKLDDIEDDPLSVVRRIYKKFSMVMSDEVMSAIEGHIEDKSVFNTEQKPVKTVQDLEHFDLDEAKVQKMFGDYMAYFKVRHGVIV